MNFSKKVLSAILTLTIASSVSFPALATSNEISINNVAISIDNYSAAKTYPSNVEGFLMRLYELVMKRDSDDAGIKYWKNRLVIGEINASNVARFFFSCDEFYALNYSDDEYINVLYSVFFNRTPDKAGKDYWLGEIKKGSTKRTVLEGFIASEEWANTCLDFGVVSGTTTKPTVKKEATKEVVTFINSLYTDVLGRDSEKSGLDYWAGELAYMRMSAKDVASGFFFSPEFGKIYKNSSADDIVKIFYKVFFDRTPDDAGLKYWKEQIKGGMSLDSLFSGFVVSPEFSEKCQSMGILVNMPSADPVYNKPEPSSYTPVGTEINTTNKDYIVETTNGNVVVNGYYDAQMAYDIFVLLNDYRTQNGLSSLAWSSDMLVGTNERSIECCVFFDKTHTRPNGQMFNTVTNGKLFKGENLAVSSGFTAQEFFDAWKNSDQHNKNMLNPNYKTVSISIFVASTTNPYANKTGYYNYGIQNFGK